MIEYQEKEVNYTSVKIKLSMIKDEVDWDDLPLTTGSFLVAVTKKSGDIVNIPEVTGSLLNVFSAINDLGAEDYEVAAITQSRTIHD